MKNIISKFLFIILLTNNINSGDDLAPVLLKVLSNEIDNYKSNIFLSDMTRNKENKWQSKWDKLVREIGNRFTENDDLQKSYKKLLYIADNRLSLQVITYIKDNLSEFNKEIVLSLIQPNGLKSDGHPYFTQLYNTLSDARKDFNKISVPFAILPKTREKRDILLAFSKSLKGLIARFYDDYNKLDNRLSYIQKLLNSTIKNKLLQSQNTYLENKKIQNIVIQFLKDPNASIDTLNKKLGELLQV